MTKLNQIIAIEKGTKTKTTREYTDIHQQLQKNALLSGISRTYQPNAEDGDMLPSEKTLVQVRARDMLKKTQEVLTELFDVSATKDETNCAARANVMVDEQVLLRDVPVTTLLFLEKQLTDLHTFVKKLPVLDPSEEWRHDPAADCWATEATHSIRTKKVMKNHEKAPATDKHPAQVETFIKNIPVGTWKTVKFSGALPQKEVNEMLVRVEKLQKAIKFAREEANAVEIKSRSVGKEVFDYLFKTVH